jgi:hypothetical protein
MELLYLLVEDCAMLGKHKEVCFTGNYSFHIHNYSTQTREMQLNIEKNDSFPSSFFSPNIANITGIIGENGTGKTSFLEFLKRLFTQNIYYVENFLAVFKKDETLLVYHTLYDFINEPQDEELTFYENQWTVSVTYNSQTLNATCLIPWGIDILNPHIMEITELKKTKTIYYSGIFDLKGYPYPDKKQYIDLSTNFLIEKDAYPDNFSLPDKNILLRHKHKNILRQIKLVTSSLLDATNFKLPETISLIFEEVAIDIDKSRDIDSEDKKIYKYFRDRLYSREYPTIKEKIRKQIDSKSPLVNRTLNDRCKFSFIEALLKNFFKNIDNGDYYDSSSKVDISTFDQLSFFDAVNTFFSSQALVENEAITALIQSAYKIIENYENYASLDNESRLIEVKDKTSIIELLSNYEYYLNSFSSSSSYGFISTEWRDLSSGEKAFLDLFSRLYDAKQQIFEESNSEGPIDTVYILLDEAEIGFHPEWQRKYLYTLEKFLSFLFVSTGESIFRNTKTQIIIASHSPFLASDLPKSNIVFLKKEDESLLNVDSINREQTFGANIHTLYSNSFFLESTIGEFAKKKINDLITYAKSESTASQLNDEAQKMIDIIGEPIVKNKLQNLLNIKRGKQATINWHKDQITKLEGGSI